MQIIITTLTKSNTNNASNIATNRLNKTNYSDNNNNKTIITPIARSITSIQIIMQKEKCGKELLYLLAYNRWVNVDKKSQIHA